MVVETGNIAYKHFDHRLSQISWLESIYQLRVVVFLCSAVILRVWYGNVFSWRSVDLALASRLVGQAVVLDCYLTDAWHSVNPVLALRFGV